MSTTTTTNFQYIKDTINYFIFNSGTGEKNVFGVSNAFISSMLWLLIILLVVSLILYDTRIRGLPQSECNFMDNMYSKMNGNLRSINAGDPQCGYALRDYYIKTAYNSCSGGYYKNDYVNTCVLKDIIKQGVRCLDFEIYNINDSPVVATSTTDSHYIKETFNSITFNEVMNIITTYAFSPGTAPNSNDPLIIHLRFKSNSQAMFSSMANILAYYNRYLLGKKYSFENNGKNLGDVPLMDLTNKIILIADRINPSFVENNDLMEFINMTSNSIFMRALDFYDVAYTPDITELQLYNGKNMTIVLPNHGEANPDNPNGIVCRETGCQMVAMRYQYIDNYLEENTTFFNTTGYAFVLKPDRLRYIPETIPVPPSQNPAYDYATRYVKTDYYSLKI